MLQEQPSPFAHMSEGLNILIPFCLKTAYTIISYWRQCSKHDLTILKYKTDFLIKKITWQSQLTELLLNKISVISQSKYI